MEIASQHAEAVGECARMGMEEWLLLDGIALGSGNVSPGNVEFAAAVVANFADTGLAFGNGATVTTGEAAQAVVLEIFDEMGIGLMNVIVEDCAESGHDKAISSF